MDFRQLIRNWHLRAEDKTLDYFAKFIFEYLSFIAILKRVRFVTEDSDTHAVIRFKSDEIRDTYLNLILESPEIADSWNRIKQELEERPLGIMDEGTGQVNAIWYWRCTHPNTGQKAHVCEEQGKLRDLRDWENMVEFWHSIRNNLFHGAKDPQDYRDSLLVENGFKTLSPLVNILLQDIH